MKKSLKKNRPSSKKYSTQTLNIHGQHESFAWEFDHHLVPPLTASTTFRLDSLERGAKGFSFFANPKDNKKQPIWIYDRLQEPSTKMLEEQLVIMENGECAVSFSSGMGAISSTLMTLLSSGQKILSHHTLYGCTYSLITNWLTKQKVEHDLFNLNNTQELQNKLKSENVRVVYFESISNPNLEILDLKNIVSLVQQENKKRKNENKIFVVVDNTFATPWSLRPLDLGVDFVIQSLTKNIAGFGTEMGGAVITKKQYESDLLIARKDFGAIMHPYSAWHILVYGIPTQGLRFEKQQESALKIAKFLEKHPKIEKVIYPGLSSHPQFKLAQNLLKSPEGQFAPGTMISFYVKGNEKKCERFVDYVAKHSYTMTLAVSLGLIKTLIEVPGYMTHSAIPEDKRKGSGIDSRMIRLSIGLENSKDIINDIEEALETI